jgi:hypothetical protein
MNYDDRVLKRIVERRETKESFSHLFEELYDISLSETEARKELRGIENHLIAKKESKDFNQSNQETISINKDGSQTSDIFVTMTKEQSKDTKFLLKAHGYDPKIWQIVSARNNAWNSYSKKDGIQTLYSTKIIVKPLTDITLEEIEEHFNKMQSTYKYKEYEYKENHSNKMLEINISDLHFGKLGWSGEIGENFDHKIARKRLLNAISDIIKRTKYIQFEKIILPTGNDFFNFDTIAGTTTLGTAQDNDLRWSKLFLKGTELYIEIVDMLKEIAPVEIFYVAGNHDKMTSYYLINYLNAWYRKEDNVNVDISPMTRKYIKYGNSLIGFAHGNTEKKRIDGIMQVEAREDWGKTKFHEWHLSHLHSEHVREDKGIIIRNISSLTGSDAWHYESGYVGAIKKLPCFIWDKKYGNTDILHSIIDTSC